MTTVYTKDHEWMRVEGEKGIVGITDFAQSQLGEIVYAELPEIGAQFSEGDVVAVVESVKAASEIYIPVKGSIIECNSLLIEQPNLLNTAPTGDGWIFKVLLSNSVKLDNLMTENGYQEYIQELG